MVGAGVIGLHTACRIQEELPNVQVTIVADKFTTDTLSGGVAGIFRPSCHLQGPEPNIARKWHDDSWEYYRKLHHGEDAGVAGIVEIPVFAYSNRSKEATKNLWLESVVPVWRDLSEAEMTLVEGDFKYGSYYITLVIDPTYHLPYMFDRFKSRGGKVVEQNISSFMELHEYDVIVNCTAMGAKKLCNDNNLVPVRGQVYKVKAGWIKAAFYDDLETYIIPGVDYVTLGGCRNFESWDTDVNKYDSAAIWERCTNLLPNLKRAVIQKEFVGLRPHREPVRIEKEIIKQDDKQLKVVHVYGFGGYGITLAPGAAMYATQLVKQSLHPDTTALKAHL